MKNNIVYLNIARKDYRQSVTFERANKTRKEKYHCIIDENGNFSMDKWTVSKKSNIRFELVNSSIKYNYNLESLSDFAGEYLQHVSAVVAVAAVKSIYTKSCNPYIYSLYMDTIRFCKSLGLSLNDDETFTFKPKYRKNAVNSFDEIQDYIVCQCADTIEKTINSAEIVDDTDGNDIFSVVYETLLSLARCRMISEFSHVWSYAPVCYRAVNNYVMRHRRNVQTENIDTVELIADNDSFTVCQLFDKITPVLIDIIVSSSDKIDDEKAKKAISMFKLSLFGYSQKEIANFYDVSRDTVNRQIMIVSKYIKKSEIAMDIIKKAM